MPARASALHAPQTTSHLCGISSGFGSSGQAGFRIIGRVVPGLRALDVRAEDDAVAGLGLGLAHALCSEAWIIATWPCSPRRSAPAARGSPGRWSCRHRGSPRLQRGHSQNVPFDPVVGRRDARGSPPGAVGSEERESESPRVFVLLTDSKRTGPPGAPRAPRSPASPVAAAPPMMYGAFFVSGAMSHPTPAPIAASTSALPELCESVPSAIPPGVGTPRPMGVSMGFAIRSSGSSLALAAKR